MSKTIFNVEGMTCSHCEAAVKRAVSAIGGVTGVAVDLSGTTVAVPHDENAAAAQIKNAIEEQGYDVIGFDNS
jgi:copper chaperone